MSVGFSLDNFDDIYRRSDSSKIVINDIDIFAEDQRSVVDNYIFKNYTEDNISLLPSCTCGELKGESMIGMTCMSCNTPVMTEVEDTVNFLLYSRRPEGVEKFISPIVMYWLMNNYKIGSSIHLVRYLTDTTFRIDPKVNTKSRERLERFVHILTAEGYERGYNNFVRNFFPILDILEAEFSKEPKRDRGRFPAFLKANEDKIFSDYLPYPNRSLMVMNGGVLGRFVDRNVNKAVDCVRRMTGIDIKNINVRSKQNRVSKTLLGLSDFYAGYTQDSIFSKGGLARKHIGSTRSHFTARSVIVSITEPHEYDEIHLPWSIACTLFEPFLLKRLLREGWSFIDANEYLSFHLRQHSPTLEAMFIDIVNSVGGVPMLFGRNPSLHRGSVQTVRMTRVKTDTWDNTIGMSYLIAQAYNADFDGDAMNLTLPLTANAVNQLENFAPYHSLLEFGRPNEFSSTINFPKTVISNLASWYNAP